MNLLNHLIIYGAAGLLTVFLSNLHQGATSNKVLSVNYDFKAFFGWPVIVAGILGHKIGRRFR